MHISSGLDAPGHERALGFLYCNDPGSGKRTIDTCGYSPWGTTVLHRSRCYGTWGITRICKNKSAKRCLVQDEAATRRNEPRGQASTNTSLEARQRACLPVADCTLNATSQSQPLFFNHHGEYRWTFGDRLDYSHCRLYSLQTAEDVLSVTSSAFRPTPRVEYREAHAPIISCFGMQ